MTERQNDRPAIGIDLGGTNIKAALVDPSGELLEIRTAPTEDHKGPPHWIQAIGSLCEELLDVAAAPIAGVGLCSPGLVEPSGRAVRSMPGRLQGVEGLVWEDVLQVGGRPLERIPVLNDAHAALLGEAWVGAARGERHVVLLTLGTGVGGAALVDGRLLRGAIGRAGHFGHMSLDPEGPLDICHTPGSLELTLSSTGLREAVRRAHGPGLDSSLDPDTMTVEDLVARVREGDRLAVDVWGRAVKWLAAGITSLVNALDPTVVVLGGGIVRSGEMLWKPLESWLDRFRWQIGDHRVRVVAAEHEGLAGALGAARVVFDAGLLDR